jgi:hypothetical protein
LWLESPADSAPGRGRHTGSEAVHDVFVSYRHTDSVAARLLVAALESRGLAVWFDESSIGDFGSISGAASEGLAQSKALVVYYSKQYPLSAPCQWELTQDSSLP